VSELHRHNGEEKDRGADTTADPSCLWDDVEEEVCHWDGVKRWRQ
jgi:hypothetical protein